MYQRKDLALHSQRFCNTPYKIRKGKICKQKCEPRAHTFLEGSFCRRHYVKCSTVSYLLNMIYFSDCNHNERVAWQWKDTCRKTHQGM